MLASLVLRLELARSAINQYLCVWDQPVLRGQGEVVQAGQWGPKHVARAGRCGLGKDFQRDSGSNTWSHMVQLTER